MESRREFLRRATVTLLLVPVAAAGCSSTNTSPVLGNTDGGACSGAGATSTVVGGHAHTVCVDAASLSNPPAQGLTFTTSVSQSTAVSQSHSHTVTLSQMDLQTIGAGGQVTVPTSTVLNHSHQFMLVKMAQIQVPDGGLGIFDASAG